VTAVWLTESLARRASEWWWSEPLAGASCWLDDANVSLEDSDVSLEDANVRLEDSQVSLEDEQVSLEDEQLRLEYVSFYEMCLIYDSLLHI